MKMSPPKRCPAVFFYLSICLASSLGNAVSDVEARYRPTSQRSLGSVGNADYRKLSASVWWNRAVGSLLDDHLLRLLGKRVTKGDSPRQIVIAEPGVPSSRGTPLSAAELASLAQNKEFLTQVGPKLSRLKQWSFGRTVSSLVDSRAMSLLAADPELKELMMTWSTDEDFLPSSFEILSELRLSVNAEDWNKYRKLAVALALVDDQIFPSSLPHSQVDHSQLPPPPSPLEKFADIVAADKSGTLLRDISILSVGELFFIVAHRITLQDLAWARLHRPNIPADKLPAASFASVRYQDSRVESREYSWSKIAYTPENILLNGGICVDQAYYSDLMCKAAGIPSMMFTGTGDEGGHAWIGFLTVAGVWDVTVGRSGGVYLTGKTYNPQTWKQETDHDFSFFTAEAASAARMEANLATMFWEEGFPEKAKQAIDSASILAPSVPYIWDKKFAYGSGDQKPSKTASELKTVLRNKNLSPSVRATVKRELASAEREMGRHAAANRVEKNIIEESMATRSDIGSQALADRIRNLLENGEVNKALGEYKIAIRNLPEGSKGDFFYNVTRPLGGYLADVGQRPQAMQVVRDARKKLNPPKNSLLDLDLKELEQRAAMSRK